MTQTIESENGVVTATPLLHDEAFYLNRFKECVTNRNYSNGRIVDEDFYCELYKGFAIVVWKQEFNTPTQGVTRTLHQSYVWEVGGFFDHITNLGWLAHGCVTVGWGADTLDKSLKKVRKKIDLLSLMYSSRDELKALSITYCPSIRYDEPHVFNAGIGDVVAIRAFGRTRLGKVITTTGNRFIVAYMTPSNAVDVHYKTLPLNQLYGKKEQKP